MNTEDVLPLFISFVQNYLPGFRIEAGYKESVITLLAYFSEDQEACRQRDISLKKGLFLMGPVGCGKTTLMKLCRDFFARKSFCIVPSRKISQQFADEGYSALFRYGSQSYHIKHLGFGPIVFYDQPITYCLDDVGVEPFAKHFGNNSNVIAEVLLDRYEEFVNRGLMTHLTTNLNAEELQQHYHERIRSRLREMCNLIAFPTEIPDWRK